MWARRRNELARHRAHAVPGDVSRSARPVAGRPGAGARRLVAADAQPARPRPRAASRGGRHPVRRRRRHGDAAGRGGCRDFRKHCPRATARPVVYLTPRGRRLAQADARRLRRRGPASCCSAGATKASTSGCSRRAASSRSRSATTCCPAASRRRWCCWTASCGCCRASWAGTRSGLEESFADGLLEYPHYTKPADWQGHAVPEILLSGNHAAIAAWRRAASEADTRARRPDLWEQRAPRSSFSALPIPAGHRN